MFLLVSDLGVGRGEEMNLEAGLEDGKGLRVTNMLGGGEFQSLGVVCNTHLCFPEASIYHFDKLFSTSFFPNPCENMPEKSYCLHYLSCCSAVQNL